MLRKLIFVVPVLLFAGAVNAQISNNGQLRLSPQEIKALKSSGGTNAPGSSNYSAVKEIVLMGNPAKRGLYTILLEVAPNTRIAAHLHPDQRMATVLSGTWHFGYGNKFDETRLKTLPAGSVYSEVAGQNHFAMTGNEPVIVQVTGYGPSGVVYADPKNDPSHK
ncbi:cupin domain-containing protein [Mucilaginibacter sp. L3T2-6]|uniref:cupin domain-containing protein n=1 Tax=Mucilaginibacter sp. L3T2-6 TaxID=3062491 RepID=UPI002674DA5D|nr:cupin domain-containing protein [Mucilaginibacter sp. L3T2-6]MDO3645132.1 cupin domain-containing protein [Mucilaginibacter sp. L3T2-6]MDV6217584.1 cupin domain-containing protein [Mucilaginibacter sp. L3T2-6]